jgi:cytochrome P450
MPVESADIAYDHASSANTTHPYETWEQLRRECPVAFSSEYGGFYFLTKYEDVCQAALNCEVFSSADGTATPPQPIQLIPEEVDPPEQRWFRRVLNPEFAPGAVSALEPKIRVIARDLMAKQRECQQFDFGTEFSLPFPRMVTMEVVGIPASDVENLSRWVGAMATREDIVETELAGISLFSYLQNLVTASRELGGGGLVDSLLHRSVEGRSLTDDEMVRMLVLLLLGGLTTTTGAISGMTLWLADHPEDVTRLRNNPEMIDSAIDEFVRHSSPISHIGRVTREEVTISGCTIPMGARVMLGFGAANRDPDQFERPEEVVLDRPPSRHLGFGLGPHRCVGLHLARLMIRVALEELLSSFGSFRVADRDALRFIGGEGRALISLPLSVSPLEE